MGYSTAQNEKITITMGRYEFERGCDISESTIPIPYSPLQRRMDNFKSG
jgi:hypothetical protein